MNRRDFLKLGVLAGAASIPRAGRGQERFIGKQGPWRKFEVVTRIEFKTPQVKLQAWVPVPSVSRDEWSKPLGSDWKTNAKVAKLEHDAVSGGDMAFFEWTESKEQPVAEVSSHISTRDRLTDFTRPGKANPLTPEEQIRYTTIPASMQGGYWGRDNRLRTTAAAIIANAKTDLGKAKAIYEWIVDQTSCGPGDMTPFKDAATADMVERWDCGYLNRIFVGLARVSDLPAREYYGIRVAPSLSGYESMSAIPENITVKEHRRAEVWLEDYGWVPVDPGDVRRVIRDEPPGTLTLESPKVVAARVTLFGAWEGNWVAYNSADDLVLPGTDGVRVPYLARPLARSATGWLDDLKPEIFSYKIMSKELPA